AEIERHPAARRVITGGEVQIERLKRTLIVWLREMLSGPYDSKYEQRRLEVGHRHVEIGLEQVYASIALSRIRIGLIAVLGSNWTGDQAGLAATMRSLNKVIDLDLAKIEDAYHAEFLARQQRLDRLATIGQVGSGVAHELRNPLNNIKTSAYYLLNVANPPAEKRDQHLKRIQQNVQTADRVITTLSNYAKMPVPDLRPTNVRQVAEEALSENGQPANIQVVHDWAPALPPALADADQLRIVISNLIRNALDAMPTGGTLILSGRSGNSVEVTVTDTGVGMSAQQLARITEPLFTTKAKGLGLGLALARSILEKNQGSLHVTSQPGAGSTFTVRLNAVTH
ncbi:MAG TPA: ATP-binding protein, partial [Gemmataceae bacterium]|nr:ATP-binding protein [Gemmataceae bacterium]